MDDPLADTAATATTTTAAPPPVEPSDGPYAPSPASPAAAPAPPTPAVAPDGVMTGIRQSLDRLAERFEQKILDDQFKEDQVRRLHAELQEYKRGLLDQAVLPLLSQIIRLHENLRRQETALRQKPPEQLGPERVFKEIAGVRDELEVMLGESGVAVYEHPSAAYDANRQVAREVVPTDDPTLHGTVCQRVLPGYERDGRVLFKERVKVYALRAGVSMPAPPPPPPAAPAAPVTESAAAPTA